LIGNENVAVTVSSCDKSEAARDVRQHILLVGSRKWRPVREKHSAISEPSWWRLVRAVRQDMARVVPIHSRRTKGSVAINPPSGLGNCHSGDNLAGELTQLQLLDGLRHDAMAMREAAYNQDGTIRDAAILERSVRLRCHVISRAVKLKSKAYENLRAGIFFEAVIEVIREEAPDVSDRIVGRLRALSGSML
jgi:hypothetical protein